MPLIAHGDVFMQVQSAISASVFDGMAGHDTGGSH
jgi:hypothetical protein